jgi:GcrA cell cycle regulator
MMEITNWAPEHSAALRDLFDKGKSFSQIARAINAKFKTTYSRNAALGRAKRMGLDGADRPEPPAHVPPEPNRSSELRPDVRAREFHWPRQVFETAKPVKLRCVAVEPRHLSLVELEWGDCRYPYGGDTEGEAITFCGHPRRSGSSYCTPHFHLSRNPEFATKAAPNATSLRVVEAA